MSTLSEVSQGNIGWVFPPQPQTEVVEQALGVISGFTQLIQDQDYVDVAFSSDQPTSNWTSLGMVIVNTLDSSVINVWPGVISSKTASGFRLQLNGLPDSGNYYLRWSIRGVFGYTIDGPVSGNQGSASTPFTVQLVSGVIVDGTVVVTPHASAAGTFTPSTVSLTNAAPSATFTFTPSSSGVYVIGATNNKGLIDAQEISYTAYATQYSLSGPSSGNFGEPSTPFTVALPVGGIIVGSVTITPSAGGGGGSFTPTSVVLTTAAPSQTFTYTPASGGVKTISTTNSGTLTNPTPLSYTSIALVDGDPVSQWKDSSVNVNHATMTGSNRPTFKTAIVNGKPVVRFTSAGVSKLDLTSPISGAFPWIVFAVMKRATGADRIDSLDGSDTGAPRGPLANSDTFVYGFSREGWVRTTGAVSVAFHIIEMIHAGAGGGNHFTLVDGTADTSAFTAGVNSGNFTTIGYDSVTPTYCNGDIAEIIIYAAAISGTDRQNIEKYLGTKYGITVPAGSAVQPDTVAGLMGWWKADSLG